MNVKDKLRKIFEELDEDDVKSILVGDEFLIKLENLFEAFAATKMLDGADDVKLEIQEDVKNEFSELTETTINTLDKYLEDVVDDYFTENSDLVEQNIKAQTFDSFFGELVKLMEKFSVPAPDGDTSMYEKLEDKYSGIEEALNSKMRQLMEARTDNQKLRAEIVLIENTQDFSDVQIDKLINLMEGFPISDIGSFENRVKVLKESILLMETDEDEDEDQTLLKDSLNPDEDEDRGVKKKGTSRQKTVSRWAKHLKDSV